MEGHDFVGPFLPMPALTYAQTASQPDAAGVREAIRFERSKDAADARQARREARHPTGDAEPGARNPREDSGLTGTRVGDPGEQEAIRFERAKDRAASKQARKEAGKSSSGAADRQAIPRTKIRVRRRDDHVI